MLKNNLPTREELGLPWADSEDAMIGANGFGLEFADFYGNKKAARFAVHAANMHHELVGALEGLYKSVVKEVGQQGRGYSESNLLCLKEFKAAKDAIEKARSINT